MPKTNVKVSLVGKDGNAFAVLGAVKNAMVKAGLVKESKEFMNEAMSGDYNHLLVTAMKWVEVE